VTESSLEQLSESSESFGQRAVIVSGLSGSGKSSVLRVLEDLGFFCIDNLPVPLLPKVLELAATQGDGATRDFAFVVDTRERDFLSRADETIEQMRSEGANVEVVFLEADDETLIRRYSETRRPHPMGDSVREGIALERQTLAELREHADLLIDTSKHTVHTLKDLISSHFDGDASPRMKVTLMSFGFKHGLPPECDITFDVRFLPNPYFVEGLREKRGTDAEVRDWVLGQPEAGKVLGLFREVGEFLPFYEREGKSYLTVGIGCTGGHHRSVSLVEAVAMRWRGRGWSVDVRHRDIER
jgi:UPF0042 nucleotide-binding protein